jgi:hypothetical protein
VSKINANDINEWNHTPTSASLALLPSLFDKLESNCRQAVIRFMSRICQCIFGLESLHHDNRAIKNDQEDDNRRLIFGAC